MRHIVILFLAGLFLSVSVYAQESEEHAAITRAALDYIEGWFTKDPERMERALHYQMIKRMVTADPENGRSLLDEGSALRLVQGTRPVPGREVVPLEGRKRDVTILDVYGNAATVKIDTDDWVDYLHLVKWNDEWKILNVLWELKPR